MAGQRQRPHGHGQHGRHRHATHQPLFLASTSIVVLSATGDWPTCCWVVVVEGDGQKIALEVDELLGQQQVVVKNIENNYRRIAGVSGATILGDGRVALIVDIGGLVRSLRMPQAA